MNISVQTIFLFVFGIWLFTLTACGPPPLKGVLGENVNATAIRLIQTRIYDLDDPVLMLRAVISTLQDLDFVIDLADSQLGLVTATKVHNYRLRFTVMVEALGKGQMQVRASCQMSAYGISEAGQVLEPEPYQDFFASLGKNIFLEQNVGT